MCYTERHFEPKPIVIAERFYFHQRNQGLNESVAEYITELRKLALHCEFGEFLKDALRDQLVCGLRSDALQKQLLAQTNLTLDKALQIAQGMEAAEKSTKTLQGDDTSSSNTINSTGSNHDQPNKPIRSCYRCGHADHLASACRFRAISVTRKDILQKFVRVDKRTVINSKQTRNNLDRVTHLLTDERGKINIHNLGARV